MMATPASSSSVEASALAFQPVALDVRKCVERAFRDRAGYARQPVEAVDHDLTSLVELGHHRGDRVLRPGQRSDPGVIARMR